jgi:hypothetical protein
MRKKTLCDMHGPKLLAQVAVSWNILYHRFKNILKHMIEIHITYSYSYCNLNPYSLTVEFEPKILAVF